jgi:hypothetical protein
MSIVSVNFQELYERHLCRHSQYGINVIHLATLVGTYLAIFGIVAWLFGSWWPLPGIVGPYLLALAFNLPPRVFLVLLAFTAALLALFFVVPGLPVWVYPLLIVAFYKLQSGSHKLYTAEKDMTEFNKKYPRGFALFVLLSLYELPLLLNYLVFDRRGEAA